MATQFSIVDVRALLQRERESEEPDAILEILKSQAGKKFTVYLLRKLPGGEARWAFDYTARMTHIKDRQYRDMYGSGGISLLLSYVGTGPGVVDPAWVESHNASYFEARVSRNKRRDAMMYNEVALDTMAKVLTNYAKAKEELDRAKADLDSLTAYGQPFSQDQYELERLCGAREPRK